MYIGCYRRNLGQYPSASHNGNDLGQWAQAAAVTAQAAPSIFKGIFGGGGPSRSEKSASRSAEAQATLNTLDTNQKRLDFLKQLDRDPGCYFSKNGRECAVVVCELAQSYGYTGPTCDPYSSGDNPQWSQTVDYVQQKLLANPEWVAMMEGQPSRVAMPEKEPYTIMPTKTEEGAFDWLTQFRQAVTPTVPEDRPVVFKPNGEVQQPIQRAGMLGGMNPMMLLVIAGVAGVAIMSQQKRPRARARAR